MLVKVERFVIREVLGLSQALLFVHNLFKQGTLFHLRVPLGMLIVKCRIHAWCNELSMDDEIDWDIQNGELGLGRVIVNNIIDTEKPDAFFW